MRTKLLRLRQNVGSNNIFFVITALICLYCLHVTHDAMLAATERDKLSPPFGFKHDGDKTDRATSQDLYQKTVDLHRKVATIDVVVLAAQELLKEIRLQLKLSSIQFPSDNKKLLDLSARPSYVSNINYLLSQLRQLPTLNDTNLLPGHYIGKHPRTSNPTQKFEIVIGIPTVYRSQRGEAYLLSTIRQLSSKISTSDRHRVLLSVFIAEIEQHKIEKIIASVQQEFAVDIQDGLLEIYTPTPDYYPAYIYNAEAKAKHFPKKDKFGDDANRQLWRTKQNLDFIFLWMQSLKLAANYYLQVEDDINVATNIKNPNDYFAEIMGHLETQKTKNWLMLDFAGVGFIGKLFRQDTLAPLTQFLLLFYQNKPCDWLLEQYFIDRYCSPEWKGERCSKELHNYRITIKPSIFKHIGKYSSLDGKIQRIGAKKSEINAENRLLNVKLYTSLMPGQAPRDLTRANKMLNDAYKEGAAFWAAPSMAGDVIYLFFKEPKRRISTLTLISGDAKHPDDKFPEKTQVSVLHANQRLDKVMDEQDPQKALSTISLMLDTQEIRREVLGLVSDTGSFFLEKNVIAVVGKNRPIVGIEIGIQSEAKFWIYVQDIYVQ